MPQVYCLLAFKGYFVRALNRQQAEAVTTEIDGPIPVKVQTYS